MPPIVVPLPLAARRALAKIFCSLAKKNPLIVFLLCLAGMAIGCLLLFNHESPPLPFIANFSEKAGGAMIILGCVFLFALFAIKLRAGTWDVFWEELIRKFQEKP
jgi:hypothetical protein